MFKNALALALVLACLGCQVKPQLSELPVSYASHSPNDIQSVPVILVGQVQSSTALGPIHSSRWEGFPNMSPQQLWRTEVRVENVLQGEVGKGEVNIYFSVYRGNLTGGALPLSLSRGERVIFFLMRDSGELRTICDGWDTCIERVKTGSHLNFKTDSRYMNEAIVDLLLTRGEGGTDKAMVDTIKRLSGVYSTYGKDALVKKLRQLANTETPAVRAAACAALVNRLESSCEK